MRRSKPFWESRTIGVNVMTFLTMALALFVDFPATARYAPWLTLAIALVNLGLRFITTEPVTLTRKDVVPPGMPDLTPLGEVPPEVTREPNPNGPAIIERHDPRQYWGDREP